MIQYIVFLGAIIHIWGSFRYLKATLRGQNRPNRVSFLLWGLAPMIGVAAALQKGVGISVIPVFMAGLFPLLTFCASFYNPKAYWKSTPFDYVCGFFSILALVLWGITKEPNIAILFAIISDGLAGIPTIKKAWLHPHTETSIAYFTATINETFGIIAIRVFNFASLAFPIYLVSMNIIILFSIYRKQIMKKILNPFTRKIIPAIALILLTTACQPQTAPEKPTPLPTSNPPELLQTVEKHTKFLGQFEICGDLIKDRTIENWRINREYFIPQDAFAACIKETDLQKSEFEETIIIYTTRESSDKNGLSIDKIHLQIHMFTPEKDWQIIKSDESTMEIGDQFVFEQIALMQSSDETYNLLVQKKHSERSRTYYIFGDHRDTLEDFPIQKGYLNPEKYLSENEKTAGCFLDLTNVAIEKGYDLSEGYNIFCDTAGTPRSEQTPERSFILFQKFDPDKQEYFPALETDNETSLRKYDINNQDLITKNNTPISSKTYQEHLAESPLFSENYTNQTDSISLAHKFINQNTIQLHFNLVGECGGCATLLPTYLEINPSNDKISVKNHNPENKIIFSSRAIANSQFSADLTKVLFVDINEVLIYTIGVYDFILNEETILQTLFENESVGENACHGVCENAFGWNSNSQIWFETYNTRLQQSNGIKTFDL